MNRRRHDATAAVLGAAFVAWSAPGHADLNKVPGMNEVQAAAAATIQQICAPINALPNKTPQQTQLGVECRKMVQTSNALPGQSGPTANSLGLSEEQLRFTMQGIAPDENGALTQGSTVTSPPTPIAGRLLELRRVSRGLSVADSSIDVDGVLVATDKVLGANARGGGAAADASSAWGGFLNVNYNTGDRSQTSRQFGFDFDSWGVTGGVDHRFNPDIVAGAALTYDHNKADYEFGLGDVKGDGVSLSLYGSWTNGPWYFDGHVSYSWIDYDTRRNIVVPTFTSVPGINTSATGSTKGTQGTISVGVGYDWKTQGMTVTPYGRVGYLHLDIDSFTESENISSLGLDINGQSMNSLQTALGVRASGVISTSYGVLGPYAGVEWNHEFEDNSRNITAAYTFDPFRTFFVIPTDGPDRDFFTLSLGISAQFARGIAGFFSVQSVQGLSHVTNTGFTLGIRGEF
jgi:outer membrane autotransporter protein